MPKPALVLEAQDLKRYEQRFVLHTDFWDGYVSPETLQWKRIKFRQSNRGKLPKTRGVYAFVVSPPGKGLPRLAYLMYVGETGNTSSARHLRQRFAEYLAEQTKPKRSAVFYFLNCWSDYLYFHYAAVPDLSKNTVAIETRLCDLLQPPYTSDDFSPAMRKRRRAFLST